MFYPVRAAALLGYMSQQGSKNHRRFMMTLNGEEMETSKLYQYELKLLFQDLHLLNYLCEK